MLVVPPVISSVIKSVITCHIRRFCAVLCLLMVLASSQQPAIAGDFSTDETLIFEQSPSINSPIRFTHESPLIPDNNDFELLHWQFMSNRIGERWAMITIKNTASGQRIFVRKDIVATFANGQQSFPVTEYSEKFQADEVKTLTIYFGERRFPLAFVSI